MKFVAAFLLTFVAGPAAFWVLARQNPTRGYFILLWLVSVALVGVAYALRLWIVPSMPDNAYAGLSVIMALWFGWIIVLALGVLAVRARDIPARYKRYAFAIGAVATTLPWFGLYAAQMVTE
ncbi:MAG: hypothetical protein NXH84_00290 [Rhodobacteraceae bacterium]|nr:hypothetical protein [Paracoccaceae bacterium]